MTDDIFRPRFLPTMTASVPYRHKEKAIEAVLKYFPEAPCIPIMTTSLRWMLEGIPCLTFDRQHKRVVFDIRHEREAELITFYDKYDQEDLDYFKITPEVAPCFYGLLDVLKRSRPESLSCVHFETAGPVLLSDVIKQSNGRSSFFDPTLRDILIKGTRIKSKWILRKITTEVPDVEIVAGHPETTLVNFTSASGSGTRNSIISAIDGGFQDLDCIRCVHCCSNIDWSLLTDSNINMIHFDAYQHTDKLALYHKEIAGFLKRGGMLGWGIVPVVNESFLRESVQTLFEKLSYGIDLFVSKGIDEEELACSSWVLPSCETVMMTPDLSDRAFCAARRISQLLRNKYGYQS